MDYALLLVVVGSLAVGVVGAVVRTWSIHSRLYSLEDRVSVVEGTLTREVKIRAAQSRPPKSTNDEALLKELAGQGGGVLAKKRNWWERLPKQQVG